MANVQGRIRIPLARYGTPGKDGTNGKDGTDGEDAVTLVPSTYTVTFTESMNTVEVLFSAYQGETQVTINSMGTSGSVSGVTVSQTPHSDGTITYSFYRANPSAVINGTVDFTGRIIGGTLTGTVSRTVTLRFESVADGEDGKDGTNGEDGISVWVNPENVVFVEGVTVAYVTVMAHWGTTRLYVGTVSGTASDVTIVDSGGSTPATSRTLTVTRRFPDDEMDEDAALQFFLYSDAAGQTRVADIDWTLHCAAVFNGEDGKPGADGVDGLWLDYNPNMVFGAGETSLSQTLTFYRGSTQVAATRVTNSSSISSLATVTGTRQSDGTVMIQASRSSTSVNISEGEKHTFLVTLEDGTGITVLVMAYSVKDGTSGKDGDPGKDGDDGVSYGLDCAYSTIKYNGAAGAFAPTSFSVSLYKMTGGVQSGVGGEFYVYATYVGDSASSRLVYSSASGTQSITVTPANYVNASYGNGYFSRLLIEADISGVNPIEHSVEVTWSAMPRIQVWDDCSASFQFESGQAGEQFMDFVYYTISGNDSPDMYQCTSSHVKSSTTPDKDTSHWTRVNYFNNVATQVLLATTAKIDNLYVDDLFMVGQQTCIWLNPDNDGMKINPVSALASAERKDQSATATAWENPLAEFSARNLPSLTDIFQDGAKNLTGSFRAQNVCENNLATHAYEYYKGDPENIYDYNVTVSGLSSGDIATISVDSGATVRLTEGSTVEANSYMTLYIAAAFTASSNDWQTIAIAKVGGGVANTEYYAEVEPLNPVTMMATSARVYFRTYVVGGLNYGAKFDIASAITVRVQTVRYGYVARYCANGMFVGISTQDYLRFVTTEDSTGGLDRASLQLKAGGQGLNISADGALQTIGTTVMPIGGMLLAGYVWLDGDTPKGYFNTWDGLMPTLKRTSLGIYLVTLPEEWKNKIGVMSPWTFAVTVQARGNGNAVAYVTNVDYYGDIQVGVSTQQDGGAISRADFPFYIQVTYVGNGSIVTGTNTA